MAVFKCKMCGGTLEINNGESVVVCDYCGTKQTLPKTNDEAVSNLFNRANTLRLKSEFDKAEQVYEKILELDNAEAEAHWGLVLCKYGIEYVEDPQTFTRVPTCHRASYDSILADESYLSAVANADMSQKVVYEDEAKKINDIQKNILDVVKNEKPFDVFICYKETDANGQRTIDSVIANDIYHQLTNEGFKVFYAAITLEDKLGQEYEPYIFSALNSAKVMLVVGTKPEYFEAVWVKNEWSRFLKLLKADRSKLLIPCYRDMDAYDLPNEFSHLQSQDMSKIGFINDIERGIKKVIVKDEPKAEPVVVTAAAPVAAPVVATTEPLLKRAYLFLEDGDWESADEYCEKVLDLDPENSRAYLGKAMVAYKSKRIEALVKHYKEYANDNNYIKAIRFADDALKAELESSLLDYQSSQYEIATRIMGEAETSHDCEQAAEAFAKIVDFKDSRELYASCVKKSKLLHNEAQYSSAVALMESANSVDDYQKAIGIFKTISDFKDSSDLLSKCNDEITALNNLEMQKQACLNKINNKKSQLANKNGEYYNLTTQKNNLANTLDSLGTKNSIQKPYIITLIGALASILVFIVSLVSGDPEAEMSTLQALAVVLSTLGCFGFGLSFFIFWVKMSRKLLDRSIKEIVKCIAIMYFIPFAVLVYGFKDYKALKDLAKENGELNQRLRSCEISMNQCRAEITELEAEIQQLSMQLNQLVAPEDKTQGVQQLNINGKIREELLQAIDIVVEEQTATAPMLQRKLNLGYAAAARMLDELEEIGVVGPFVSMKPRQVLISKEQWAEMRNNYL